MRQRQQGFTLIELLVTLGIFAVLTSFVLANVIHAPNQASLQTVTSTLVSDIKSQQLRSMLGDTDQTATAQTFGVYLQNNQYTLFDSPYASNATTNFVVPLENNILLTTTFPSSQVIFIRRSGEVSGFVNGANTITVQNINDGTKHVITVNQYGTVRVN